jgi:iron(III) transport system permease protein
VPLSLLLAYGVRRYRSASVTTAVRVAGLGYAVPGSVIAVGTLIPFAMFDNTVDAWMRSTFGISTGLLLTGTIAGVVFACLVRFLAVSLQTVEASLTKISPSIDAAARSLGSGTLRTALTVHAPIMGGSLLTAWLIVFVDTMKELPATLLLRPFNFDTLAVQAYHLAKDERLAEASTAALAIVAVGLIPVLLLSRSVARARPGLGSEGAEDDAVEIIEGVASQRP